MTVGKAVRPRRRERARRGVGGERKRGGGGFISQDEGFIESKYVGDREPLERVGLWEGALLRNDARP